MNNISKPHLVGLLRIFDHQKYFLPRIRYASVRSKPELVNDLMRYFGTRFDGDNVFFLRKPNVPKEVPKIHYSLSHRKFYFDGVQADLYQVHQPCFRVLRGPVTVHFGHHGSRANLLSM